MSNFYILEQIKSPLYGFPWVWGVGNQGKYKWGYLEAPEGNGTPLQYSCLENPVDGGA